MRANLGFEISEIRGVTRWLNWASFVESSELGKKKSDTLVLFVSFNKPSDLKRMLEALQSQEEAFDVLVVDNHSIVHASEILSGLSKTDRSISVIRSIANLGGAGGYALGLEWALEKGYDFFLVTEDDVHFGTPKLVDELVKRKSKDEILRVMFQGNRAVSYTFHFNLYPRKLLEITGVPDPRYFMRDDDFEWGWRNELASIRCNIPFRTFDHLSYRHPVYQFQSSPVMQFFHFRNAFRTSAKLGFWNRLMKDYVTCWLSAASALIFEFKPKKTKLFISTITDFILQNQSLEINLRRMSQICLISDFPVSFLGQEEKRVGVSCHAELQDLLSLKRNFFYRAFGFRETACIGHPLPLWGFLGAAWIATRFDENLGEIVFRRWVNSFQFRYPRYLVSLVFSFAGIFSFLPVFLARSLLIYALHRPR